MPVLALHADGDAVDARRVEVVEHQRHPAKTRRYVVQPLRMWARLTDMVMLHLRRVPPRRRDCQHVSGSVRTGSAVTLVILALVTACSSATQTAPGGDPDNNINCPNNLRIPPVSASIVLTAVEPIPTVRLRVGQAFRATAKSSTDVVQPQAANPQIICQATSARPGHERTITFVATAVGETVVESTITGVPGGLNHPAYQVNVIVTAADSASGHPS